MFFKSNKALLLTAFAAVLGITACERTDSCSFDEKSNTLSCVEKTYKTMNINGKTWLSENLASFDSDSSFCYGSSHFNCEKFGRLYAFESANRICPEGWRLPNKVEFEDALNELQKTVEYAGFRYYDGKFADEGLSASFWTSDAFDDARATLVRIKDSVTFENFNKNIAASVRCIKK